MGEKLNSKFNSLFCFLKKVYLSYSTIPWNKCKYKAMLLHAEESGLGETTRLDAGTIHTRPSLNPCLLKQSHVQIKQEKNCITFSRQINPKIQVNSPPVQEIPASFGMRDTVIYALVTTWILIWAVMVSTSVIYKFKGYEIKSVI